jgi:hypothetical protein
MVYKNTINDRSIARNHGRVDAGVTFRLRLKFLIKTLITAAKSNGSVFPGAADFFSLKEINYVF